MSQVDSEGLRDHLDRVRRPGPVRTLVAAVAADSIGQGLLISMTTFYMLRIIGLSAVEVGSGLTLAAILGIVVSAPIGYIADRWNPLSITVLMISLQAVAVIGYLAIDNLPSYLAIAAFYAVTFAAGIVSGAAMLPTIVPPAQRVQTRATTRVTSNIGITVGVGLGGLAVGFESVGAYRFLFVVTAVGLLLSAYCFHQLRRYQNLPETDTAVAVDEPDAVAPAYGAMPEVATDNAESAELDVPAVVVLRDRPYLAITAISALMSINDGLLTVALPLWISQSTSAPPWTYSLVIGLNTVAVVLFQIPVSRSSETAVGAGRALRSSGAALAAACLLWAVAGHADLPALAIGLLLVGALAHVFGEIACAAGGWGLSYELAPDGAHGKYQGVFGTGQQIANAVVPVIAGVFLVQHGLGGWSILAAVLLGAGLLAPMTVAWALRTPPRITAATPVATS